MRRSHAKSCGAQTDGRTDTQTKTKLIGSFAARLNSLKRTSPRHMYISIHYA